MRNLLTATLPALALLALGGCASTGALTTSTETDGVYYSSKDRTTAVNAPVYGGNRAATSAAPTDGYATAPAASPADNANPDYQGSTTSGTTTTGGSDYYSDSYGNSSYTTANGSGFGQPYAGPGVSSFNYTPSSTYAVSPSYYGSPYGYASAFGYGYSPYSFGGFGSPYGYGGFYDPFYSSFYSPFGYGFGSGLSIGFGYGFGGFGYGGFGGYGYPYGYGYSPFYGSGYGYGYNDYRYGNSIIRANGVNGITSNGAGSVLVGSRPGRGGYMTNGNNYGASPVTTGANTGGRVMGNTGGYSTGNAVNPGNVGGGSYNGPTGRGGRAVSFGEATGQPSYSTPGAGQPAGATGQPATTGGGRRGFFSGFFGNGATGAQPAAAGQSSTNNSGYSGRQRSSYNSYGNGQTQTQRSYSQPSYSQPSRSSFEQRSFSQPSRSFGGGSFGGGGGGGSFGGGGGGGGGRGRR